MESRAGVDSLKNDDGDAAIGAAKVMILPDRLVAFDQFPTGFVGETEVLAGDEAGDQAIALKAVERLPDLLAQSSADTAGAIPMDQLEDRDAFVARGGQSMIQVEQSHIHGRAAFLEIDDLAAHGFILTAFQWQTVRFRGGKTGGEPGNSPGGEGGGGRQV